MQMQKREQIMKLLNLDSMINEYLAQPSKKKKQTTQNQKSYKNNNYPLPINSNNRSTHSTLQNNNNLANKRAASANNFTKNNSNTISYRKNCQSVNKVDKKIGNTHLQSNLQQNTSKHVKSERLDTNQSTSNMGQTSTHIKKKHNQQSHPIFKSEINLKQTPQDKKHNNILFEEQGKSFGQIPKWNDENYRLKARRQHTLYRKQKNGEGEQKILKSRYRLEKIIGRGLSGIVYQAEDILSHRKVAIKIIDLKNEHEYQFIKKLSHQNMIEYYNCFEEKNSRYLVLEYLPLTLNEVVKRNKLSDQQVHHLFTQIANGVMYLHSMSYAHRDIKLDNIVTNDTFQIVKFIDFGLCVDASTVQQSELKRFCGTTSYMAPQIIDGKCKDPKKADIWALGVVLYALSVGRLPFVGRQQNQIHNKIKNNKTVFPSHLNQSIKQLLVKMLQKDPGERANIFSIINHNWVLT